MAEKSILIVDDIPSNIKLLSIVLKKEGYVTYEATDGFRALELAKEVQPTLILLDVMMPIIDGYETCTKLKDDSETCHIPVIFVTAKTEERDKIKGLNLGAVDYITKPFHKAEVLARVRNHMALEITKNSLVESEMKYSTLVENVQDGIFLWQPEAGIVFANKMLYKMVDGDNFKKTDLSLESIFAPEFLNKVKAILANVLEDGSSFRESNFKMRSSSGAEFHASCIPALIQYSGEQTVLVTVRDMTERIEFEHRLTQTQKLEAVGSLTSGIVHDFNNILAIVNGYAELALLDIDEGTDLQRKVELILSAGRGATSLTKGLLTFARGGKMQTRTADLNKELETVKYFVGHSLPKSVELNIIPSAQAAFAKLDVGLFQQVVVNLCINARDAMARGGRIDISSDLVDVQADQYDVPHNIIAGRYIRIDIADTGTGIPEGIRDKIFNPFFTTKDIGKGTGLGLSMVARIIQDHGGWIDLESKTDVGSTFSIYLPQVEWKEEVAVDRNQGAVVSLNPILVVDDDEVQGNMMRYFLELGGYTATAANSGQSALNILAAADEPFKVLVVDYLMPEMNGLELCEKVMQLYPEMKIIFVSGGGNIPACGNKQLRKPFTCDSLLATVAAL